MFKTKFPLGLTINGEIDAGKLVLKNTKAWLRYERLPGYPAANPVFVLDCHDPPEKNGDTLGPWQIADEPGAALGPRSRLFKLTFDGSKVNMADPNSPYAAAIYNEETIELDLYMGKLAIPRLGPLEVIATVHVSFKLDIC